MPQKDASLSYLRGSELIFITQTSMNKSLSYLRGSERYAEC